MVPRPALIFVISVCAVVIVLFVGLPGVLRADCRFRFDLSGDWKMMRGNREAFSRSDFDDRLWPRVKLPNKNLLPQSTSDLFPLERGDVRGYVWYRKDVVLGDLPRCPLYFQAREIMNADRVYINGTLIGGAGRFPPAFLSAWSNFRSYEIPANLLQRGQNQISIQVYFDSEAWISGPLELLGGSRAPTRKMCYDFFLIHFHEIFFFLLLATSLQFVIIHLFGKKEISFLFYSISSLSLAMSISLNFIENQYAGLGLPSNMILAANQSGIVVFIGFTSLLFKAYSKERLTRIRYTVTLSYVIIGVAMIALAVERDRIIFYRDIFIGVGLPMFIGESVKQSVAAFRNKNRQMMILFLAMAPTCALGLFDAMNFIYNIAEHTMVLYIYGFPLIYFLISSEFITSFTRNLRIAEKSVQIEREATRIKDEFLANTSHELRTPLQAIIGLAEALRDTLRENESGRVRDDLDLIIASGRRLAGLVNDLLDFSQMKNREIILQRKPVDLRQAIRLTIELNNTLIRGRPLVIRSVIPDDLPAVWGDEDRIIQILQNLVGNAVKFTAAGTVVITARPISEKEEKHSVNGSSGVGAVSDRVEVSVSDTGPGIDPARTPFIFHSFEQADGGIARQYGGTGLGLAITRSLVELHGGEIWVESQPGRGATFFFTLPVALEKSWFRSGGMDGGETAEPPVSSERTLGALPDSFSSDLPLTINPGGKYTILIVDDERIVLQTISRLLDHDDYELTLIGSGEEALRLLQNESGRFDMVLLDVMMPDITGYDLCRRIRKIHSPDELPVLLLTARNRIEDMVAGLNAGANDYLVKPFENRELMFRVHNLLRFGESMRMVAGSEKEKKQAVEEEKRRIYMDLHHHLGGRLTDLTLLARKIQPGDNTDPALLDELNRIVQHTATLLRGRMLALEDISLLMDDFLGGIRLINLRRYSNAGRPLRFSSEEGIDKLLMRGENKNIRSALHETLTEIANNDLKYGCGESKWIFALEEGNLLVRILTHTTYNPATNGCGRGTECIQRRIAEIGGKTLHEISGSEFRLLLMAPLN